MKKCLRCDKEKPAEEFSKNKSKRDGLNTYCRECQKPMRKAVYGNRKREAYSYNKEKRAKKRKWLTDYKSNLACKTCGESHPSCLQFHHLDKMNKDAEISKVIYSWSIKRILKEIEKCEVLCANCHFKLHWNEE